MSEHDEQITYRFKHPNHVFMEVTGSNRWSGIVGSVAFYSAPKMDGSHGLSINEAEALARMWAKAPELLDVIREYISELDNPVMCHVMRKTHRNRMRDLIAEIEGGDDE